MRQTKTRTKKRARTHGFLARKATTSGKNIIRRRMRKGRARIAVTVKKK